MSNERLTTTRYVTPGTYIGELIRPSGAELVAERRILVCVGRGDRLAVAPNLRVRRSFIFNESLSFPKSPSYVASLQYESDEDASSEDVVLQKTDGSAVRKDHWRFTGTKTVEINSESFDATADYVISYQSIDRNVLDPIPISDVRQVSSVGLQEDQEQFIEGLDNDYFVTFDMEGPNYKDDDQDTSTHGDPIITNTEPTIEAPLKVEDGGGSAKLVHDSLTSFTHGYDRSYELEVVEVTGTGLNRSASFKWKSLAKSGGNNSLPNNPLYWDNVNDQRPSFIILENSITTVVDLELGLKIEGLETGADFFKVGDKFSFYVFGPALLEQDIRIANENQYNESSPVVKTGTGSGDINVDLSLFNLTGSERNVNYELECIEANNRNGSILINEPGPIDGNTLTINDEVNSPATVFEFGSSPAPGNVPVAIASKGANGFIFLDAPNPSAADTITITDAVSAVSDIFEFTTGPATGNIDVLIGGTNAITAGNLVTAILGSSLADIIAGNVTLATSAIERLLTTGIPTDGETITIDDGLNTPITFEFDDDSSVEVGNIAVEIKATKELTIAELITAINNPSLALNVNAQNIGITGDEIIIYNPLLTTLTTTSASVGYTVNTGIPAVILTHGTVGASGNTSTMSVLSSTIKATSLFSGGGVDIETTTLNLETAINNEIGTLSITATKRASSSYIDLSNDVAGKGVVLTETGTSLTLIDDSADIASFVFNAFGEESAGGKFTITQGEPNEINVGHGVILTFTDPVLGTFNIGDVFNFTVKSERIIPTAKDNREVFMTVTGVISGIVNASFVSNTPEGSFGSLSFDYLGDDEAYQTLPGQLKIVARNISSSIASKRIVQSGLPNDGETVTVSDGVNTEVFEFDTNGSTIGSGTPVDISGAATGAQAIQALSDEINASSTINVFATFKNGTTTYEELFVHNLNTPYTTELTITISIADNTVLVSGTLLTDASLTNAPLDEHEINYTSTEFLDWSLTKEETVEIDLDAHPASQDVNGSITGTVGTFYIVLPRIPLIGTAIVTDLSTGEEVYSEQVITNGSPTAFIKFSGNPNTLYTNNSNSSDISVFFEHVGNEPTPGQDYYMTIVSLRPDEFYDSVQIITTRADGQQLLAPSTVNNHLYIANEIAYDQDPGTVIAYIQIKDSDDDGIYSQDDFNRALNIIRTDKRLTDYIILSQFQNLNKILAINVEGMDPFVGRENLVWTGAPIGTEIGTKNDLDSLVGIAKGPLQVYGNSPAHGTRILHASTWGKKTVTLNNGLDQELTLDGSFIAVSLATLSNSFTDPGTTILRKAILGWNDIQTYGDHDNLTLGAASIIFLSNQGSGVFRVKEDITVDKFGIEFSLVSVMVQKQVVTKVVRSDMDTKLIALVNEVVEGSISAIEGALVTILNGVVGRGFAAPYQDDQGVARSLDPTLDIKVTIDEVDPTTFHFGYGFFTKKPIKRLFGLYVVDRGFNQD